MAGDTNAPGSIEDEDVTIIDPKLPHILGASPDLPSSPIRMLGDLDAAGFGTLPTKAELPNSNREGGTISPKTGSAGGPGSGKRIPDATKAAAQTETDGSCVFCGKKTTKEPGPSQTNIDHAIPKSRGGNNTIDNAQTTCRSCNLSKGTMTTEEYMRTLGYGR